MGFSLVLFWFTQQLGEYYNYHCIWFSWKSHLYQKYDQEVEVSDSSELLKQVLGNEVPEGILWDRVTAGLLSHTRIGTERETMARHHPLLLARETVTHGLTNPGKMKGVILKKHGHKREITWLSKYETKEQRDDKQCCGTDSRAVARSPWRRRCGCRGNAEGCRPRLPEGVLYARCTPSDCPPRSPPPHTDGERDLYTAINSNTGREKKTGVKSQCSASVKCLLTAHKLHKLHTINTTPLTNTSQSRQHLFTTTMFLLNADRQSINYTHGPL